MVSDTVVAIIPEEALTDVLTQVHRAGFGQNSRVLRPRRSPLRDQLRRAGISVEQAPDRIDAAPCVLLIIAAARSTVASELVLHHGASATWIVARDGDWRLVDDHVVEEATVPGSQPRRIVPQALVVDDSAADASESI